MANIRNYIKEGIENNEVVTFTVTVGAYPDSLFDKLLSSVNIDNYFNATLYYLTRNNAFDAVFDCSREGEDWYERAALLKDGNNNYVLVSKSSAREGLYVTLDFVFVPGVDNILNIRPEIEGEEIKFNTIEEFIEFYTEDAQCEGS